MCYRVVCLYISMCLCVKYVCIFWARVYFNVCMGVIRGVRIFKCVYVCISSARVYFNACMCRMSGRPKAAPPVPVGMSVRAPAVVRPVTNDLINIQWKSANPILSSKEDPFLKPFISALQSEQDEDAQCIFDVAPESFKIVSTNSLRKFFQKKTNLKIASGPVKEGKKSALDKERVKLVALALGGTIGGSRNPYRISMLAASILKCEIQVDLMYPLLQLLKTLVPEEVLAVVKLVNHELETNPEMSRQSVLATFEESDLFIYEMSQISQIKTRLECMIFAQSFDELHELAFSALVSLFDALEVLDSKKNTLAEFFHTILAIGNSMNEGSKLGSQSSFSLVTLLKLCEVKSSLDPRIDLLHFVLAGRQELFTDLEIKTLRNGGKCYRVREELKDLIDSVKAIDEIVYQHEILMNEDDFFLDKMESFYSQIQPKVEKLEAFALRVFTKYKSLSFWFFDAKTVYPPPKEKTSEQIDLIELFQTFATMVKFHEKEAKKFKALSQGIDLVPAPTHPPKPPLRHTFVHEHAHEHAHVSPPVQVSAHPSPTLSVHIQGLPSVPSLPVRSVHASPVVISAVNSLPEVNPVVHASPGPNPVVYSSPRVVPAVHALPLVNPDVQASPGPAVHASPLSNPGVQESARVSPAVLASLSGNPGVQASPRPAVHASPLGNPGVQASPRPAVHASLPGNPGVQASPRVSPGVHASPLGNPDSLVSDANVTVRSARQSPVVTVTNEGSAGYVLTRTSPVLAPSMGQLLAKVKRENEAPNAAPIVPSGGISFDPAAVAARRAGRTTYTKTATAETRNILQKLKEDVSVKREQVKLMESGRVLIRPGAMAVRLPANTNDLLYSSAYPVRREGGAEMDTLGGSRHSLSKTVNRVATLLLSPKGTPRRKSSLGMPPDLSI